MKTYINFTLTRNFEKPGISSTSVNVCVTSNLILLSHLILFLASQNWSFFPSALLAPLSFLKLNKSSHENKKALNPFHHKKCF